MRKIYLSKGSRSLTFMLAGRSPATSGERAALQLPLPACDVRQPPPYGPTRPAGDGR